MNPERDWLIAGVGSAHGADQLGWKVIEALAARGMDAHHELRVCQFPAQLPPLLLKTKAAIVVDALLGGHVPGSLHVLRGERLPHLDSGGFSHGLALGQAIQLALALGMPPDRLVVLALEVGTPGTAVPDAWVERMCMAIETHIAEATA